MPYEQKRSLSRKTYPRFERVDLKPHGAGGSPAGLNPDMKNPLANDPDAVARGAKDFDAFNCSGCHMAHGGGGMGPALSDAQWLYRTSDANIYLDIAQGRDAGVRRDSARPHVWEIVAYVRSIREKPPASAERQPRQLTMTD